MLVMSWEERSDWRVLRVGNRSKMSVAQGENWAEQSLIALERAEV
jgi:hypothetical protein